MKGSKSTAKKSTARKSDQPELLNSLELDCLEVVAQQLLNRVLSSADKGSLLKLPKEKDDNSAGFKHAENLNSEQAYAGLRSRVSLIGRGQQLQKRPLSIEKSIGTICRAILTGYCIQARYNNRDRILRPYGLVVREPKIYLVAAEHDESGAPSEESVKLKHYLCNRIENVALTNIPCGVPERFSIDDYLKAGSMEIPIHSLSNSLPDPFELVLRLKQPRTDNLLRDIEEFPLEKSQAIIKAGVGGDYLLTIPRQTANVALVNWIFSLQDRVEVVEPLPLRQYVIAKFHASVQSYLSSADSQFAPAQSVMKPEDASSDKPTLEAAPRRSTYAIRSDKNGIVRDMILTLILRVSINGEARRVICTKGLIEYLPADIKKYRRRGPLSDFSSAVKNANALPALDICFEEGDPFTMNSGFIAETLGLSEAELRVFRLCLLIHHHKPLQRAIAIGYPDFTSDDIFSVLNVLLGFSFDLGEHCLADDQILRTSGIIRRREYGVYEVIDAVKMSSQLVADVFRPVDNVGDLLRSLCDQSPPANIDATNLEHLSNPISHLQQLIRGACEAKEAGINILLWGPPGTGKTQLARYILQSTAKAVFEVKTTGLRETPLEEAERLSSYNLCQAILSGGDSSAIIFDEAENILKSLEYTSGDYSKGFINRVLEDNPVPAIWVSNKLGQADPAYLRRFAYVVEVPHMTIDVKRRIAERILHDIPINGELLEDFLARQEVGPALLSKLKRMSVLADIKSPDEVDQLALSMVQGDLAALGAPPLVVRSIGEQARTMELPYDPEMINPDRDLRNFVKKVKTSNEGRLLFFGPPGTGKTAWAKYLAAKLGKPANILTPADIKGMYVGQSEKAIKEAFATAENENAVLIFDEVDSFLHSRNGANESYQVDLVNQFLISLENYNGVLVCSTNLVDSIDQAALRRFDFKVEFRYLRSSQASSLFLECMGLLNMGLTEEEAEHIILDLPDMALAPGDFAVVLRQAWLGGEELTVDGLWASLMAEVEFRRGSSQRTIGFN